MNENEKVSEALNMAAETVRKAADIAAETEPAETPAAPVEADASVTDTPAAASAEAEPEVPAASDPEAEPADESVTPAAPEPAESMEDYAKELNSSLRKIYEGDIMEGEVIAFNEHGVILDLNYYATGRVPVEEMSADPAFNIMTDVKIGDRFQAVVKSVDDGKGNILLSKKEAESEHSWDKLRAMKEDETVVSGTISEVVRAGAIMYVEGVRGFIPASKLDIKYVEDTAPYLGRKMNVKISEVDEERRKLILSAREILNEEHVRKIAENVSRLSVGSIVTGKVESLQNYGAFVNLGDNVSGLLHISEISEQRINHPKAVLRVGQEVTVMIKRIENGKVSLSMKAVEAAKEQETEEEAREYRSEYVPNNPFADLLKDFMK